MPEPFIQPAFSTRFLLGDLTKVLHPDQSVKLLTLVKPTGTLRRRELPRDRSRRKQLFLIFEKKLLSAEKSRYSLRLAQFHGRQIRLWRSWTRRFSLGALPLGGQVCGASPNLRRGAYDPLCETPAACLRRSVRAAPTIGYGQVQGCRVQAGPRPVGG